MIDSILPVVTKTTIKIFPILLHFNLGVKYKIPFQALATFTNMELFYEPSCRKGLYRGVAYLWLIAPQLRSLEKFVTF